VLILTIFFTVACSDNIEKNIPTSTQSDEDAAIFDKDSPADKTDLDGTEIMDEDENNSDVDSDEYSGIDEDVSEIAVGCPTPMPEGMVFCYDFEDWTGSADTTPGYPFGEFNDERWELHKSHTEVLSSCSGWTAHSGNFFFYGNAFAEYDSCLGDSGGSRNTYFGKEFARGNSSGFILEDVLDDQMYLNFKTRLAGDWKTNTQAPVKFTRTQWLSGGMGDSSSNCVHYGGEENYFMAPGYPESAHVDSFHLDNLGIDFSDGEWHDFAYFLDIAPLKTAPPTGFHVIVWVDGHKIIDRIAAIDTEYILEHQPVKFYLISFLSNFWGTELLGTTRFAFDDIKVWNKIPEGVEL